MKRYRFVFWIDEENKCWKKEFDSAAEGNEYALEYMKENGKKINWDYDDNKYILDDIEKIGKMVKMYGIENVLKIVNGEELSAGELHDIAFANWCDGKWEI